MGRRSDPRSWPPTKSARGPVDPRGPLARSQCLRVSTPRGSPVSVLVGFGLGWHGLARGLRPPGRVPFGCLPRAGVTRRRYDLCQRDREPRFAAQRMRAGLGRARPTPPKPGRVFRVGPERARSARLRVSTPRAPSAPTTPSGAGVVRDSACATNESSDTFFYADSVGVLFWSGRVFGRTQFSEGDGSVSRKEPT